MAYGRHRRRLFDHIVEPYDFWQSRRVRKSHHEVDKTMSEKDNAALIRDAYDGFARGEPQIFLNALAEDVEWETPTSLAPLGGKFSSRDQVATHQAYLAEHLDFHDFGVDQIVAQGDTVIALGYEGATVKSTGKSYDAKWAHVFTFGEGRIVKFFEYVDTAVVLEALKA